MKTYTHPTITLPAGSVVVKFYDDALTGSETTPDFIRSIGDIEEGFDINLGEVRVPDCEFVFRNAANYVLGTLLNTTALRVSVMVGSDLYFYGDIDFGSFDSDPDVDPTTTLLYSDIKVSATDHLASMGIQEAWVFVTDMYDNLAEHSYFIHADSSEIWLYFKTYFYEFAKLLSVKHTSDADINYTLARKYYETATDTFVYLKDIIMNRLNYTYPLPANTFQARFANAFECFGELCREFGLFPCIVWDGTDFKMQIREKDLSLAITAPIVRSRKRVFNYMINEINVDLEGHDVVGDPNTELTQAEPRTIMSGEAFDMMMHHTSIYGYTYLYNFKDPASDRNVDIDYIVNYGDATNHTSLQKAIFNHYKSIFFGKNEWYKHKVSGIKGTISGVSKIEYLQPGYNFTADSITYHIHSVKKSVMRNESELLCLITN